MPTTSVRAIPKSPRYSCTQLSKAAFWKSRKRTFKAWNACMNSCAIVPMGVMPISLAMNTLEVPRMMRGAAACKVSMTWRCHW